MSHAWGQTEIRGITNIETDGIISDTVNNRPNKAFEKRLKLKPIDKSDSDFEIRFYNLASLSNTNNLRVITYKNDQWASFEYDEWNKPRKIKKYILYPTTDFPAFIAKLLDQKFTRLPNQSELQNKMKKFTTLNGGKAEQKINVLDGSGYTMEFRFADSFRIYQFSNPDSYSEFYSDVEELKNYVAIKNLFETELLRKE